LRDADAAGRSLETVKKVRPGLSLIERQAAFAAAALKRKRKEEEDAALKPFLKDLALKRRAAAVAPTCANDARAQKMRMEGGMKRGMIEMKEPFAPFLGAGATKIPKFDQARVLPQVTRVLRAES